MDRSSVVSAPSLASCFPWVGVLGALGVRPASPALPALVNCPICHGSHLTIYDDSILHGAWHHCRDCHSAGDMVELACAAWRCSAPVAVARLLAAGLTLPYDLGERRSVLAYVNTRQKRRRCFRGLWEAAAKNLPGCRSAGIARLLQRFHLSTHMSREAWAAGPAHLLGVLDRRAIELVYRGGEGNYNPPGPKQVFYGRNWADLLVIPYHDLPERICGYYFVGRRGDVGDRVFRRTPLRMGHDRPTREAGLACAWSVGATRGTPLRHVVALEDPLLALRQHLRHLRLSAQPLPLVAFRDDDRGTTAAAWALLADRVPVLWGTTATATLAVQAARAGGRLLIEPPGHNIESVLRNHEPQDWWRSVVRRSLPWRAALADWLQEADDVAAEEFVSELRARPGVDLEDFAVSRHARELFKLPPPLQRFQVGERLLVEAQGKTWDMGTRTLIKRSGSAGPVLAMNALLRITSTVLRDIHNRAQVAHYQGTITYQGTTVPFVAPVSQAAKYPRECFQRILSAKIPGSTLYVCDGRGRDLVALAIALGNPEAVTGSF